MDDNPHREPSRNAAPVDCPVRHVICNVSDKWSLLILQSLSHGSRRFSDLRREIPDVSQNMLTRTLRKLERDGLILRKVAQTPPLRVHYSATPIGTSLGNEFSRLSRWASRNLETIQHARDRFDATNKRSPDL